MDDLDTDAASSVVALLTGAEAARATIAGSRIVDADAWRTLTRRDFGCTTPNYRELTTSRVIAFGPDDESGFLGREPVSPFPHALAPTVPPPHHDLLSPTHPYSKGRSKTRPRVVPLFSSVGPLAVSAGGLHSLVLDAAGRVYAFGSGRQGQGGNTPVIPKTSSPVRVNVGAKMVAIGAGTYHSVAVSEKGAVYAWGKPGDRRLMYTRCRGRDRSSPRSTPAARCQPPDARYVKYTTNGGRRGREQN